MISSDVFKRAAATASLITYVCGIVAHSFLGPGTVKNGNPPAKCISREAIRRGDDGAMIGFWSLTCPDRLLAIIFAHN